MAIDKARHHRAVAGIEHGVGLGLGGRIERGDTPVFDQQRRHRQLRLPQVAGKKLADILDKKRAHRHPLWVKGRLVMRIALVKCRLLLGRRFLLVFLAPFVIGHAVDDLAALLLGHRQALAVRGVLHPVRQAVATEAGEIHQVNVLDVRARAQMFDQAPVNGRFQLNAGFVVHASSSA
jgi:hypothetical protein